MSFATDNKGTFIVIFNYVITDNKWYNVGGFE